MDIIRKKIKRKIPTKKFKKTQKKATGFKRDLLAKTYKRALLFKRIYSKFNIPEDIIYLNQNNLFIETEENLITKLIINIYYFYKKNLKKILNLFKKSEPYNINETAIRILLYYNKGKGISIGILPWTISEFNDELELAIGEPDMKKKKWTGKWSDDTVGGSLKSFYSKNIAYLMENDKKYSTEFSELLYNEVPPSIKGGSLSNKSNTKEQFKTIIIHTLYSLLATWHSLNDKEKISLDSENINIQIINFQLLITIKN